METDKVPINGRVNKEDRVCIHSGVLSTHKIKKEWNYNVYRKIEGTHGGHLAKQYKPDIKKTRVM